MKHYRSRVYRESKTAPDPHKDQEKIEKIREKLKEIPENRLNIDYLGGIEMKINLTKNTVSTVLYNRAYGEGRFQEIVEAMK